VLYVGKARNLKARVSNYARPSGHSGRIARMIRNRLDDVPDHAHGTEALLLEQNLIKQLKPRYNVLLRDDKSFPNILISSEHPYPQIKKHRGKKSEKGAYFGPFASRGRGEPHAEPVAEGVPAAELLDSDVRSRTRPCLQYQIKRCSPPASARSAVRVMPPWSPTPSAFWKARPPRFRPILPSDMAEASEAMEFERAAALRDRIKALTQVQQTQGINPQGVAEADVVALHLEHGQACVQVFFIRANQSWGNRDFYPKTGAGAEEPEIMEAFLTQFYDDKDPPRLILLSHPVENPDLVAEALTARAGRKVELAVPQRGEKAELVENATRNARESLARRMAESTTQNKLLHRPGRGLRP
jgi:excinuclease ABC subunit C